MSPSGALALAKDLCPPRSAIASVRDAEVPMPDVPTLIRVSGGGHGTCAIACAGARFLKAESDCVVQRVAMGSRQETVCTADDCARIMPGVALEI